MLPATAGNNFDAIKQLLLKLFNPILPEVRKNTHEDRVDINYFLDSDGNLDHSMIQQFLEKLPSSQSNESFQSDTWESTIERNLSGVSIDNNSSKFEVVINNTFQERATKEQQKEILNTLRFNHKEILPLLEQENAIAYPSIVKTLLALYLDKLGKLTSKNKITTDITYFIDSTDRRADYLTILHIPNGENNSAHSYIRIHHHAEFNSVGGVDVNLDDYTLLSG